MVLNLSHWNVSPCSARMLPDIMWGLWFRTSSQQNVTSWTTCVTCSLLTSFPQTYLALPLRLLLKPRSLNRNRIAAQSSRLLPAVCKWTLEMFCSICEQRHCGDYFTEFLQGGDKLFQQFLRDGRRTPSFVAFSFLFVTRRAAAANVLPVYLPFCILYNPP